jgi:hypothetical protein
MGMPSGKTPFESNLPTEFVDEVKNLRRSKKLHGRVIDN